MLQPSDDLPSEPIQVEIEATERFKYPQERLKHRFLFTGSEVKVPVDLNIDGMHIDSNQAVTQSLSEDKSSAKKGRAGVAETPKKSKKVKAVS